jgi:hypothetical protein
MTKRLTKGVESNVFENSDESLILGNGKKDKKE